MLITQAVLISCHTKKLTPVASEWQSSAETICEPPSQYLGNYVTGTLRSYGTDDEKFYEEIAYDVLPAQYKWIDGKQEGSSIEYFVFYPKYKREKEIIKIPVKKCPPKEVGIECDEETKLAIKELVKRVIVKPFRIEKCEVHDAQCPLLEDFAAWRFGDFW